jgi:hypothetical protein
MNTHAQIMIRPHTTQSATESARQVLTLLSDYAVRNELEQFFKREWEIATGVAEAREAFEATVLKCEGEREELGQKYDALLNAAEYLLEAIDENRPADADKDVWGEVDAKAKELEALT